MKKFLILLLLVASVSSCNSTKTTSDYDHNAHFDDYKTFGFSTASYNLPVNEILRNRILGAISQNLINKGFSESNNPDLMIDLGLKTADKKKYSTHDIGLSGFYGKRWRIGTGVSKSFTKEKTYKEGTLIINIINDQQDKLLWMGSATGAIKNNTVKEDYIKNTVNKILANFPPE